MTQRNDMAASIWPHLAKDRPAPSAQPRDRNLLAEALYPNLVPKKPPPINRYREALHRGLREFQKMYPRR
jgi:hypothetical protein